MAEKVSRQREWQRKKQALGLCITCGERAMPDGNERCFRHYALRLFAREKLRSQGRALWYNREALIAWLYGRYLLVVEDGAQFSTFSDAWQAWDEKPFNQAKTAGERFVKVALAVERRANRVWEGK